MDQLVQDYLGGLSAGATARKYGVNTQTVLNQLKKRGILSRPNPGPVIAGQNLKEALVLRAEGWTYAAIGEKYGVSRIAVTNAFKRANVE
jgi:DNA-directed RNA polymerase specialized sigma24 family protein